MLGARYSVTHPVTSEKPVPLRPVPEAEHTSPFVPGVCAKWARDEGISFGDMAVLMVADPLEAAALRQGFAWVGARTKDLDPGIDVPELALVLSGASIAIIDSASAPTYARALGRLDRLPPVWWNGPGADFARLDLALAEAAEPGLRSPSLPC